MELKKPAVAGTTESSDVMIQVFPGEGGLEIEVNSSVDMYYHDAIVGVLEGVLKEAGVDSAKVVAVDHGALDCTLRARMTTALRRAEGEAEA